METKLSAWLFLAAAVCFSISWVLKRARGGMDYGDWQNLGFCCLSLGFSVEFATDF